MDFLIGGVIGLIVGTLFGPKIKEWTLKLVTKKK